jgi:hypothetical protein
MSSNSPINQTITDCEEFHKLDIKIEDYHKLEIVEIFERTRVMIGVRIQAMSFLGTANISIVALALTTDRAGLFFIAAAIGVMYLAIDSISGEYTKPLYGRGVQLEEKYASDAAEAILHRRQNSYKERKGSSYLASRVRVSVHVLITVSEIAIGIVLWILGWPVF